MSDLISALADSLIALNNASPRLPTKAEIEATISETLQRRDDERKNALASGDQNEASLEAAIIAIKTTWVADRDVFMTTGSPGTEGDAEAGGLTSIMPMPYAPVSIEMQQLMQLCAAERDRLYELTGIALPCPSTLDDKHIFYASEPNVCAACGAVKPA